MSWSLPRATYRVRRLACRSAEDLGLSGVLCAAAGPVDSGTASSLAYTSTEGGGAVASRTRSQRDVEKNYPKTLFIAKLRRLADCLEQGARFRIQIAGKRISVPPGAAISVEHERGSAAEEVEFQLKWPVRGSWPARSRR